MPLGDDPIPILDGVDSLDVCTLATTFYDAIMARDLSGAVKQPTDPALQDAFMSLWQKLKDLSLQLFPPLDPFGSDAPGASDLDEVDGQ